MKWQIQSKMHRRSVMRFYDNLDKISENRLPQRAYYIPENDGAYMLLNGEWDFDYYERDYDF